LTKENLEHAQTAFILAQKDLAVAITLWNDDSQHQNCGLHLQQASEKLIKTLIYLNGGSIVHRKGHIMGYLRGQLEDAGVSLDPKYEILDALEVYAVDGRYMILSDNEKEDLTTFRPMVESLLKHVAAELKRSQP
jgi:HEPN domain-containing protein